MIDTRKVLQLRRLGQLLYEIRYQDQEYRFRMSSESTIGELWDELLKIDKLAEVI